MIDGVEKDNYRQNILRDLRVELTQLKTCQNRVFTFGVTGAGVILGLLNNDCLKDMFPIMVLIPLLTLLPCWIVFFDKARTISRIVGYIRVQENTLSNSGEEHKHVIGWESAMKAYWEGRNSINEEIVAQGNDSLEESRKVMYKSVYWFKIYVVFALFSIFCLMMSLYAASVTETITFNYEAVFFTMFMLFLFSMGAYFYKRETDFSGYISTVGAFHIVLGLLCITLSFFPSILYNFYQAFGFTSRIYIIFYMISYTTSLFTANFTLWMFRHLVRGRYTYNAFESRWYIILRERQLRNTPFRDSIYLMNMDSFLK